MPRTLIRVHDAAELLGWLYKARPGAGAVYYVGPPLWLTRTSRQYYEAAARARGSKEAEALRSVARSLSVGAIPLTAAERRLADAVWQCAERGYLFPFQNTLECLGYLDKAPTRRYSVLRTGKGLGVVHRRQLQEAIDAEQALLAAAQ